MKIFYSPNFEKKFRNFSDKDKAKQKIKSFCKNPFDEKLETHKLKGRLKNYYAFSIDYNNRIIFTFSSNREIAYFHSIGNHDIYR